MAADFQFPIYDAHIHRALGELHALDARGVEELRMAMSVLVYRLSKVLCSTPAPGPTGIDALLAADIAAHVMTKPEGAELGPSLDRARALLVRVLEAAGYYAVDRVLMRVRPNDTDKISRHQHPSLRDINKPHSAWSRVLPFRPLFCLFGAFALTFPVRRDAKRYDDVPGEDSAIYDGGDDKPKTREDKQRTFATMLDAVDYKVALWRSHTKSELAFVGGEAVMDALPQRPRRIGRCYWRKPKGSISPDIIIVKNRQLRPEGENVTHCVDMKFGEDDLGRKQERRYLEAFPGKLLILYFPGDCMTGEPEENETVPDWVKVLSAILMLILTRGRGGGRTPQPRPEPVPG
jgi:hypothetical protein